MTTSRQSIRTQLAALLAANVPSAQAVYAYEPGDLNGQSPVLVIASAGSERMWRSHGTPHLRVYLTVDVYTRAAESATGGYTYATSADVIDTVEAQIATTIDAHQTEPGLWVGITYADRSLVEFGLWDALPYFRERIPLQIETVPL